MKENQFFSSKLRSYTKDGSPWKSEKRSRKWQTRGNSQFLLFYTHKTYLKCGKIHVFHRYIVDFFRLYDILQKENLIRRQL